MESLLILIPVALIFVAIAIKIFFWAVKSGQFEDLETEARRILFDDDTNDNVPAAENQNQNQNQNQGHKTTSAGQERK